MTPRSPLGWPARAAAAAAAAALAAGVACAAAPPADAPGDADIAASLLARGIASRPVCLLSAVDFPYKPSGLGLFAPEVGVADRLAQLGLLVAHRDAGGLGVRFELTAAGKAAFVGSAGSAGSAERGFCAGRVVVHDIERGAAAPDWGGPPTWRVTFVARAEPNPRAAWAQRPEAARLLPQLQPLQARERKRFEVQVSRLPQGWTVVSDIVPAR